MTTPYTKILETKRLLLRRLVMEDFDELFALYSDPEIRRYFPDGTRNYEDTMEELEWFLNGHPDHPQLGLWATIYKETNQFIGRCGLLPWTIDGRDEVEVAYLLAKPFWRQGLGTEVAQAILKYGFEELHYPRLICMMYSANEGSVKVAINMGMSLEKEMLDETGNYLLYSLANPKQTINS